MNGMYRDIGRPYAGQSVQERNFARRNQLLTAGQKIFGTIGFRNATVRGICREAQLTDRYFYNEFGSIEALLQAVYARNMDTILADFAENRKSTVHTSVDDKINSALHIYFKAMQDPLSAKICMLELEGVSADSDHFYHGYMHKFASSLLATLTSQEDADNQAQSETHAYLGIACIGAMRHITTHWLQTNCQSDIETLVGLGRMVVLGIYTQAHKALAEIS